MENDKSTQNNKTEQTYRLHVSMIELLGFLVATPSTSTTGTGHSVSEKKIKHTRPEQPNGCFPASRWHETSPFWDFPPLCLSLNRPLVLQSLFSHRNWISAARRCLASLCGNVWETGLRWEFGIHAAERARYRTNFKWNGWMD